MPQPLDQTFKYIKIYAVNGEQLRKEVKKKVTVVAVLTIIVIVIVAFTVTLLPGPEVPEVSSIRFGHTSCFTGFLATAEIICESFYDLWTEEVNAEGGIYLSESDAKAPIAWVFYNDMAETGKSIPNVSKLITQDNVDMIYGSYGTFQSFALMPIVNQYAEEYNTIYWAGNATCVLWETAEEFESYYLEDKIYRNEAGEPWYEWNRAIWTEMPRYWHMEALVDVLEEVGVKSIVIWEIGTLYGIESTRHLTHFLEDTDIEILAKEEYPMDILDFTPLITSAQSLNPDAIIQFSYPGDGMMSIEDMIEMDYNPKLFYNSLGVTAGEAYERFGSNLDGIMYHSTAFPKSPMSVSETGTGMDLLEAYVDKYGMAPDVIDGVLAYGTVQVMGEIVRRAGSLDRDAFMQEIMNTKNNPIQTLGGPICWTRGPWPDYPGIVGQHINTTDTSLGRDCEIVGAAWGDRANMGFDWDPGDWLTHAPVYPKPEWKH